MDISIKIRLESGNIYVCKQQYNKEHIEFTSWFLHSLTFFIDELCSIA